MSQTTQRRPLYRLLIILVLTGLLPGCASPVVGGSQATPTAPEVVTLDGVEYRMPADPSSSAPTAEPPPIETPSPTRPTATPIGPVRPMVWVDPALPKAFIDELDLPSSWQAVTSADQASLRVEIPSVWETSQAGSSGDALDTAWVYALVAPFPTPLDEVSGEMIRQAWQGNRKNAPGGQPLLMTVETKAVLESAWDHERWWGPANPESVQVVDPAVLLDAAWEQGSWAIIPFEEIEPRWKVLRVDGISPLDKDFDTGPYLLSIPIWVLGLPEALPFIPDLMPLPTNRDPHKLTTLVMTGVTALSRHIAERMESEGVTYPAREIRGWLAEADLTHISNEVSFYPECPKPGPERADMRFCSNPKYIELLEDVGTDIIELTGNHNLDWGPQPFLYTLDLYQQRGWGVYGGGANLEAAKEPLYIENNGNRLVFLGCSPAGPEAVWASEYTPGSAPCNLFKLEEQIRKLRGDGYLPVVTFQAVETDAYLPTPAQGTPDFRRMAKAGAVVVSGSQSHVPQTMTFVQTQAGDESFVHYGLGNLFFDQMKPPEARQQFIDRHIFYDGRYLGVELLTTLLEDSARPRPMKPAERKKFLQTIFSLCQWNGN